MNAYWRKRWELNISAFIYLLILLVLGIISAINVHAVIINTFLDNTSIENLTFSTGYEWHNKELGIPAGAIVSNAYIYLKGYLDSLNNGYVSNNSIGINRTTYSGIWSSSIAGMASPEKSNDKDYNTYTFNAYETSNGDFTYNIDFISNLTYHVNNSYNITFKVFFEQLAPGNHIRIRCIDMRNPATYLNIYQYQTGQNGTFTIPINNSNCINETNNISLEFLFTPRCSADTKQFRFYDIHIEQYNKTFYPHNVTILLNNATILFNYGSVNNSHLDHNVTVNFTSSVSALGTYPKNVSFRSNTSGIIEFSGLFVKFQVFSNISIFYELNKTIPYLATNVTVNIVEGNGSLKTYSTKNGSVLFENPQSTGIARIEFFDAGSLVPRRFYFNNLETQGLNISLYVVNTSNVSNVLLTLYDDTGNALQGYYVGVYRKDYPTDAYYLVEMHQTDFNGQAMLNVKLYDTLYKIYVYDSNLNLKYSSSPTEIKSTSITISIQLSENVWERLQNIRGILVTKPTFNNDTKQFIVFYNDTTGILNYTDFITFHRTAFGDVTICNNRSYNSSATLYCTIPNWNDTGIFLSTLWVETKTNGTRDLAAIGEYSFQEIVAKMGLIGVFATIIIIFALVALGLYNPVVAVVMSLLGLGIGVVLHIFYIQISTLVVVIIMGGLLLFKMRT